MSNVTELLEAIGSGKPAAAEALLPLVYDELRKLARARLSHEKPGQTLQATALVHEAYLRLVEGGGDRGQGEGDRGQETGDRGKESGARNQEPGERQQESPVSFDSRGHFFSAAAEAMRRILVESARRKKRLKRGGDLERQAFDEDQIVAPEVQYDLVELDAALDKLQQKHPRKAELVKLRYFAGLTQQQAAEVLGISLATAERDWLYARAKLMIEISSGLELPPAKE
jgi:RNA polymerase sigma factor (sigma-70 family)